MPTDAICNFVYYFLDLMEMQGRQLTPEQDALEHIVAFKDKPFLEERFIDSFKGRCTLLISVYIVI